MSKNRRRDEVVLYLEDLIGAMYDVDDINVLADDVKTTAPAWLNLEIERTFVFENEYSKENGFRVYEAYDEMVGGCYIVTQEFYDDVNDCFTGQLDVVKIF